MKYNILIADDVALNRKIMKDVLRNIKDANFFEAINGIDALGYLFDMDIDLVILDLLMPICDGFQVLKKMKSSEEHKDIPVIVCSAFDNIDTIKKALDMGAYDYFTKPLTREQMEVLVPLKVRNALKSNEQRKLLEEAYNQLEREMNLVKHMSFHDSLTGIYNRTYFDMEMERIGKDLSRFHPVSIMSIDMNDLKIINDIFGHKTGDSMLSTVAKLIQKPFRKVDIIARVGGDEFCAILPGMDYSTALAKARNIEELIEQYNKQNPMLPLSVSIGIGVTENIYDNIFNVYERADESMYEDKIKRSDSEGNKVVELLMASLSKRDYLSGGHGERLIDLMNFMTEKLGLSSEVKKRLSLLARTHDVGNIGIPDHILYKPGKLTSEEYEIVKEHCIIGYKIAKRCRELSDIATLILHHHERYDGTGYPMGLKGEDIPLECRIFAIVDAYDVMISERHYGHKMKPAEAQEEIKRCAGLQFDPELVNIFIAGISKVLNKNKNTA